jgi:hypothetical protein
MDTATPGHLPFHYIILIFCLSFLQLAASGQDAYDDPVSIPSPVEPPPAFHAIYSELGGPGMLLSLNYDTRFSGHEAGWGIRAGIGTNFGSSPSFISIPLGLNYLAGDEGNYFEAGAGFTYVDIDNVVPGQRFSLFNKDYDHGSHLLFANAVFGYRRQPEHGGLNLRAGFSPYFGGGSGGLIPYFSLGFNF